MTKVRLGNLYLAAAVAGVILCAVLMRAFYVPYSGFLRTVLYNILIFSWAVSVWWRILHAQTRRCLLGAAALMLFWLDIRLIRYDFAKTPEMLRRLWYAYYIPMLLITTLALYTLFFLDRGQSAPLYKYRHLIFVFPVVLFSLVLTNDCHQLAFAFPPGQEVLGSPDYTYRFVYYLCLLWIFSCAVFTVVYLVRRCRIPHTKRILWLPLVPIFFATLYALLYKHILNVPWMHAIAGERLTQLLLAERRCLHGALHRHKRPVCDQTLGHRYLKQRAIPHIGLDKPALDARLKGRCKGQALHHGHITGNRMHPRHIQNMLVQ